ncbi:site-specific DNA-methyltransferase [Aliarcobacter cryaerophilus]|uniref:DNA-methyltransferase n=1 Tax=Aliarcobacter cryaerophilus TaxID=28198 RepID=UPI0021B6886D|nr:site-specific DNA-methyltransferase [Aliarcobacter cryaerophilus]MCT7539251.1 site-specific DNA-methyltransferase [Aliarcobacter cryaerophilus]
MDFNIIYNQSSENMTQIESNSVKMIVTSPPYNIDIKYGNKHINGKIVESKGKKYQDKLNEDDYKKLLENVFNECKRVLTNDGSIWINIKNRFIDGQIITPSWIENYFEDMYLKNVLIWNMDWGGSTNKRFAPRYEYIYWFTKHKTNYTFELDRVKIPALNYRPDRYKSQLKNPSDVWKISMVSGNSLERTEHPAQYPERLIERIMLVSTNEDEIVLDPFMGSGTTAVVAKKLNRKYVGYEIEEEYIKIAEKRLENINDK